MAQFIVNKNAQSTGEHEVHNLDKQCNNLPEIQNQQPLGNFDSCADAVVAARRFYDNVDGCFYCARECHTR